MKNLTLCLIMALSLLGSAPVHAEMDSVSSDEPTINAPLFAQASPTVQAKRVLRGHSALLPFSLRSTSGQRTVQVFVSPLAGGWQTAVSPTVLTLGSQWTPVTVVVTTPASASGLRWVSLFVTDLNTGQTSNPASASVEAPLAFFPVVRRLGAPPPPPPPQTDAFEPDDSCPQAVAMTLNVTHTHTFAAAHNGQDVDYKKFTIPTQGRDPTQYYTFTVSIGRQPGQTRATPYIRMEWPCGQPLGSGGNFGLTVWGNPGVTMWFRITNSQQLTGTLTGYGVCIYEGTGPNPCTQTTTQMLTLSELDDRSDQDAQMPPEAVPIARPLEQDE